MRSELADLFMKAYYNLCSDLVRSGLTDMLVAALEIPLEVLDNLREKGKKETWVKVMEQMGLACVEVLRHSAQLGLIEETRHLLEVISEIVSNLEEQGGFSELSPEGWINALEGVESIARLRGDQFGEQLLPQVETLRERVARL